jgi:hypothetical protein
LNICNRTFRHRAAIPLCFARFVRQQNIHAGSSGGPLLSHADGHSPGVRNPWPAPAFNL